MKHSAAKHPARTVAADQPEEDAVPEEALAALLAPKNGVMMAVEQALLRGDGAHASPPIAEQIAVRLAGVIALDLLHPGQRLFESDISNALRVSRSPVREAIRILERDRLVELHARRGATVTAPNARELQDVYEVRATLFAILLEQVMRDRPADLEAVLGDFVLRMTRAAAESPEAYAVESFLCNLAMTDLCSNRLVVDQLKAISLRTLRYMRLGFVASPPAVERALKSWRAFHGAVAKRDTAAVIETGIRRIHAIRDVSVAAVRKPAAAAAAGR